MISPSICVTSVYIVILLCYNTREGGGLMSTTSVTIRIDNDLLKYLKERADNEERTLSNMIISILSKEMKREKGGE